MNIYKIKYWDDLGEGTTLIESPNKLDVEDAANALQEQLVENGIETSPVQVEEFEDVTNKPFARFVANIQRLGL